MKNGLWIIALVLLMATGCATYSSPPGMGYPPPPGRPNVGVPQAYGPDIGFDYMYDYLAPFGNWVFLDPYGYVWIPRHMGYRWRPYSDGYWILTDDGWFWNANEEWGSIPFHYGRWGYDDDFGWFWVPGTVWGPAWVSWRWSDQYMGWAPLPPWVEFHAGMDFARLSFNIPSRFWIFLQALHFLERDMYRYILPYERNVTIINYTSIHNNFYFRNNRYINDGIGIDDMRRITRREVPRYRIRDIRQHGPVRVMGNDIEIYRPAFRKDAAMKPKTFLNRDEARREVAPAKIFELRQQPPVRTQEIDVRKRQAEEKTLLEKTQSLELKDMQRKRVEEQAKIRDTSEKAKVRQDYDTKMTELQKQHQVEKKDMTERHKQDTEQVKRTTKEAEKEKQAPPPKKKK
jgi:hypothetical protein